MTVTIVDAADIAKSGSIARTCGFLFSGQMSSSSKMTGSVTSIGLAIKPSANKITTPKYHLIDGLRAYET